MLAASKRGRERETHTHPHTHTHTPYTHTLHTPGKSTPVEEAVVERQGEMQDAVIVVAHVRKDSRAQAGICSPLPDDVVRVSGEHGLNPPGPKEGDEERECRARALQFCACSATATLRLRCHKKGRDIPDGCSRQMRNGNLVSILTASTAARHKRDQDTCLALLFKQWA